jgi:hypothetical protein
MSDRLDWIHVATARGAVRVPWTTRDQLLERLRKAGRSLEVVRAFEAVGATRPVELSDDGKSVVLDMLSRWLDEGDGSVAPAGVAELRQALLDDLEAAGYWRS